MTVRMLATLACLVTTALDGVAAGQERVTSAATVRVRAAPSIDAAVVAELPVGTVLADTGNDDAGWHEVRTPDGERGWVSADLTEAFTPQTRLAVFERVIADRLAREGDGPPSWLQLVDFVERIAAGIEDREDAARFAWHRLRAIEAAAVSLPARYSRPHPYAEWVEARSPLVRYFELGAGYGLNQEAVVDEHDRHAGTRVADDIMWLAATTAVGGECEGYVPCHAIIQLRLNGEYLRRYPAGRHAAEAVRGIAEDAARWTRDPYDVPREDCAQLLATLDELRDVVTGADVPPRDDALAALMDVRARCG